MKNKFTIPLQHLTLEDLPLVGGKNASLGEMFQNLTNLGISIPSGFAITVDAYWSFLKFNHLEASIYRMIKDEIDMENLISLRKGGMQIRQLIRNGRFPKELEHEIIQCYKDLSM